MEELYVVDRVYQGLEVARALRQRAGAPDNGQALGEWLDPVTEQRRGVGIRGRPQGWVVVVLDHGERDALKFDTCLRLAKGPVQEEAVHAVHEVRVLADAVRDTKMDRAQQPQRRQRWLHGHIGGAKHGQQGGHRALDGGVVHGRRLGQRGDGALALRSGDGAQLGGDGRSLLGRVLGQGMTVLRQQGVQPGHGRVQLVGAQVLDDEHVEQPTAVAQAPGSGRYLVTQIDDLLVIASQRFARHQGARDVERQLVVFVPVRCHQLLKGKAHVEHAGVIRAGGVRAAAGAQGQR